MIVTMKEITTFMKIFYLAIVILILLINQMPFSFDNLLKVSRFIVFET